jgi:hypothetical protein
MYLSVTIIPLVSHTGKRLILLAALLRKGLQPDSASALLGSATGANEYAVLTILVNTAVIGNYSACAAGLGLPGILAPGEYGGESVNLLPYFNGCLKSTNVNDVPSVVNFLDGGGAAPLMMNMPANSMDSAQ